MHLPKDVPTFVARVVLFGAGLLVACGVPKGLPLPVVHVDSGDHGPAIVGTRPPRGATSAGAGGSTVTVSAMSRACPTTAASTWTDSATRLIELGGLTLKSQTTRAISERLFLPSDSATLDVESCALPREPVFKTKSVTISSRSVSPTQATPGVVVFALDAPFTHPESATVDYTDSSGATCVADTNLKIRGNAGDMFVNVAPADGSPAPDGTYRLTYLDESSFGAACSLAAHKGQPRALACSLPGAKVALQDETAGSLVVSPSASAVSCGISTADGRINVLGHDLARLAQGDAALTLDVTLFIPGAAGSLQLSAIPKDGTLKLSAVGSDGSLTPLTAARDYSLWLDVVTFQSAQPAGATYQADYYPADGNEGFPVCLPAPSVPLDAGPLKVTLRNGDQASTLKEGTDYVLAVLSLTRQICFPVAPTAGELMVSYAIGTRTTYTHPPQAGN